MDMPETSHDGDRGSPAGHIAGAVEDRTAAALNYLHDSTSGRWESAATFVGDRPLFVFPGSRFTSVAAMREGLVRRYTGLQKHVEVADVAPGDDSTVVIIVSGTLSGTNTHGVPFDGVRFLDRLVLQDGLLVEQHVYNDLAISGVLDRTE